MKRPCHFIKNMDRNVEIKAILQDKSKACSILKSLTNSEGKIIQQHDIFYSVPNGLLKMRKFPDGIAELIHYNRPITAGPKLSKYSKYQIKEEPLLLQNILKESVGIAGEVKKTRILFMLGQTRVHIDEVMALGNFIELEVVLNETQGEEEGHQIALGIMKNLGICDEDLLSHSYFEMLQSK